MAAAIVGQAEPKTVGLLAAITSRSSCFSRTSPHFSGILMMKVKIGKGFGELGCDEDCVVGSTGSMKYGVLDVVERRAS